MPHGGCAGNPWCTPVGQSHENHLSAPWGKAAQTCSFHSVCQREVTTSRSLHVCPNFMCLDHFWVKPACVCFEGGFPLRPYMSGGECPSRWAQASGVCRQLEQPVGLCSQSCSPNSTVSAPAAQCSPASSFPHTTFSHGPCSLTAFIWLTPKAFPAASSLFSILPGRFLLLLLQVASGHLRYLPESPDFYLRKNTTHFYYVQILSSK